MKRYLVLSLCILFCLACSDRRPQTPQSYDNDDANYVYHRVKYSGETLALIASWYTKSSENWRALQAANPDLNPRRLKLGGLIKIPKELLQREKSMPKEFVDEALRKAGKLPAESDPGAAVPGSVESSPTGAAPEPSVPSEEAPVVESQPVDSNTMPSEEVSPPTEEVPGSVDATDPSLAPPSGWDMPPSAVNEAPTPASADPLREQLMRELLEDK